MELIFFLSFQHNLLHMVDWRNKEKSVAHKLERQRNRTLFINILFGVKWKNAAANLFLGITLFFALLPNYTRATTSPVKVTVDFSSPVGTSQFSPGISLIDNTLNYPWDHNNLAAVNNVKSLIKDGIVYEDVPIMAWGLSDPWPDPSQPEPDNWSSLDSRLQMVINAGGIPVITLCEAPWWMKGELQSDGNTQLITQDEEWSDIAYNTRILDNKMGAWLHLVQRIAERYMVPPYNVR